MSREDVERWRAAGEAASADTSESDPEVSLHRVAGAELWDPEIEWDCSAHPLPDRWSDALEVVGLRD